METDTHERDTRQERREKENKDRFLVSVTMERANHFV